MILATGGGWIDGLPSVTRFQVLLVSLVTVSSGLLAIQSGATPLQIAGWLCAGLLLGMGLATYLRRIVPETGGWD
jgi:hypothetical protein